MNGVKSQPAESQLPATKQFVSGKLVIIAILAVALVAAGTSWWMRYKATHRLAGFWGANATALIRDAPIVEFLTFTKAVTIQPSRFSIDSRDRHFPLEPFVIRDVTAARGLVHLRHALLEDRNFDWRQVTLWDEKLWPNIKWTHAIVFSDTSTGRGIWLLFAPASKLVTVKDRNSALSYEPIAAGIAEMFAEFETLPIKDAAIPLR